MGLSATTVPKRAEPVDDLLIAADAIDDNGSGSCCTSVSIASEAVDNDDTASGAIGGVVLVPTSNPVGPSGTMAIGVLAMKTSPVSNRDGCWTAHKENTDTH